MDIVTKTAKNIGMDAEKTASKRICLKNSRSNKQID